MRLSLRCTLRDVSHTAYMIYDLSSRPNTYGAPLACLEFGPNHALGTVKIANGESVNMAQYLARLVRSEGALSPPIRILFPFSPVRSHKTRKFRASHVQISDSSIKPTGFCPVPHQQASLECTGPWCYVWQVRDGTSESISRRKLVIWCCIILQSISNVSL